MDIFFNLIWLIPLYPILAFLIIVLGLNRNKKASAGLAIGAMALATLHSWIIVAATVAAYRADSHHGTHIDGWQLVVPWLPTGYESLQHGLCGGWLYGHDAFYGALCLYAHLHLRL